MATTKVGIAPMKAVQVPRPGADFEVVEREIPNPGAGEVRIKVQACGVCHSDVLTKEADGRASCTRACLDTKCAA
jgi:D-arabinose 1-dehydrogenase-like Zn-dependent alcohol dehydrogenase